MSVAPHSPDSTIQGPSIFGRPLHSLRWGTGLLLALSCFALILWLPVPAGLERAALQLVHQRLPHSLQDQLGAGDMLPTSAVRGHFAQQKRTAQQTFIAAHQRRGQFIAAQTYQTLPPQLRREYLPPRSVWQAAQETAAAGWRVLAVGLVMVICWIFGVLPVPVTALLPLVLFPLLRITSLNLATYPAYFSVGAQYGHHLIFLFMGTFMLAQAMIRWGLDRRIALRILQGFGARPSLLLLGFILSTAFVSMWISNTASTAMMIPIALAVLERIEHPRAEQYRCGLLLGVAYSATIGGIATLVGSPPNAIFAAFSASLLHHPVTFTEWLSFGLPFTLLLLPLLWLFLLWRYLPAGLELPARSVIESPGPMNRGEKSVAAIFILLVGLWLTRGAIDALGWPGWASLSLGGLPLAWFNDSAVALLGVLLLYAIPVKLGEGLFVLDLPTGFDISWGTLILFGGGLALGEALANTGVALWSSSLLQGLARIGPSVALLAVATFGSLITEATSNTAAATILMPIMFALGRSLGGQQRAFMATGSVACSLAFILPIATPPNAIVYGTGQVSMGEMFKAGVILDGVAVLLWWGVATWTFA